MKSVLKKDSAIKKRSQKKRKKPSKDTGLLYKYGLVSTGNQIPLHNIKNKFCYPKKIDTLFYAHFL